jgi:hypothetical protein
MIVFLSSLILQHEFTTLHTASGRRALRRANQHELATTLGGDVASIIAQFFFYNGCA